MEEKDYLVSGIMTPVDINSEDFQKECEKLKKEKKQGCIIVTNVEEHKDLTSEQIKEKIKKHPHILSIYYND